MRPWLNFYRSATPMVAAAIYLGTGILILAGLAVLSQLNFPTFHTVLEILSISVAWSASLVLFGARHHLNQRAFLIIAVAFALAGALDILHTVTYKGVNLLPGHLSSNTSTQFWILGRMLETLGWVGLAGFIRRNRAPFGLVHALLTLVTILGSLSILAWDSFPVCFVEGSGLTAFKIGSEYLIILVTLLVMAYLLRLDDVLDRRVRWNITVALALSALSELAFTLYNDPHGAFNVLGHLLRLLSRFMVFQAFIEISLNQPLVFFFQRLQEENELLVASEERWRTLTETSPDHILDLGPDLRIRFVNSASPGLGRQDLMGRSLLEFLPSGDSERVRRILDKVLETGERAVYQTTYGAPDGGTIHYETTAVARKDAQGKVVALTLVSRDITERHLQHRTAEARLRISEYAIGHGLEETVIHMLDEALVLTDSKFGFFQFLGPDGRTLQKPLWSSRARVWLNGAPGEFEERQKLIRQSCVHQGEAHLHNDFAREHGECRLGRGPLIEKEMVVPIRSDQKLVAVMGVGNKEKPYTRGDLHLLEEFSTQVWPNLAAKQLEQRLETAEKHMARTLGHLPGMVFRCENNETWTMRFLSPGCADLTGYEPDELIDDRTISYNALIHPEDQEKVRRAVEDGLERHASYQVTYRLIPRGGPVKWVWEQGLGIFENDALLAIEGFIYDITAQIQAQEERRSMERKVLQAQKLESLGVLAGGIAHDFNNLLQAIMGFAELAALELPDAHASRDSLEQIATASERAAELTSQMLAFSGQGHFTMAAVDLSQAVGGMVQLLHSSISKRVNLTLDLAEGLPMVAVDPAQLQQVIMNMITNASEAAEEVGGEIRLVTGQVEADPALLETNLVSFEGEHESPRPGRYCYIEIRDNGCGMDPETLSRMFEPFFTTKFTGRGLGMAAVQGIVRGHLGVLNVESTPGEGTSVRVMFPSAVEAPAPVDASRPDAAEVRDCRSKESWILVVDDEPQVRSFAVAALETAGYQAVAVADGIEAVGLFEEQPERYCCVILDLVMPRMGGRECLAALRTMSPELPVILMSGFDQNEIERQMEDQTVSGILPKPFFRDHLLKAVETTLLERS